MRKNSFTLIELLIVLTLITVTLTVVGVSIPRLTKHEKIEGDATRLLRMVELAETIMCTKKEPVVITCTETDKGIACRLKSPSITQKITLKHMDTISHNRLEFEAQFGNPPSGQITLGCKNERRYLHLPGYPGGARLSSKPKQVSLPHETAFPKAIVSAA